MKYALIDECRKEAQPGLYGKCPACGNDMMAKCGEVRIWHWSHRGRRHCDPWWENETKWHRDWKGQFPSSWQEIVQYAEDGERHVADVKTSDDWVIEFQHSYIQPDERRSREHFYSKLVWVVDGLRRKTDLVGFQRALEKSIQIIPNFPAFKVPSNKGALLRDWVESDGHVFFDFGEEQRIWWLSSRADEEWVYVFLISRPEFIATLGQTNTEATIDFDSFVNERIGLISDYESYRRAQESNRLNRAFDSLARSAPRRRSQRRVRRN